MIPVTVYVTQERMDHAAGVCVRANNGRLIPAIKDLRQLFADQGCGLGLRNAKEAVDRAIFVYRNER